MSYTADFLIAKRKEKWEQLHSIEYDKKFRDAVAYELVSDPVLLAEVKRNPEKLIELTFVVVDKNQKTMPFFFNDVQQDFINTLNQAIADYEAGKITEISLLVLKGRQQGFTTLVTAYQLSCSILNRNFQGFTLADKSDNSESIFQNKAKYPYSQLPELLKPTEKFNNRKQLLFEKLNSSWAVDTATKDVGRSRTVNFFHGSECAVWKDGIALIQAALGEALTKNCIKIYESTANGFNDFQRMWDSGTHINCFYEWWKTKEYRIKLFNEQVQEEFLHKIDTRNDWIWERLRWLRDDNLPAGFRNPFLMKTFFMGELPVEENIAFAVGRCGLSKEEIGEMLAQVGLGGMEKRQAKTLSGGEAARVALVRAFAYDAPIILLDEPFSALDKENKERAKNAFLALWKRKKQTVVLVTHDEAEAAELGNKVVVLQKARQEK